MPYDSGLAIAHLKRNAAPEPQRDCAKFVANALVAGGAVFARANFAKNYGPVLISIGFKEVNPVGYSASAGDVVVIQSFDGGHIAGHIAMFDGSAWISDFVQKDFWGGPGYRKAKPAHVFYRFSPK
jgi:hypothetical protein